MQETFQWTDELVQEFVQFTLHQSPAFQGRYTDMEQFKSSKSPKKEWEIMAFGEHFDGRIVQYKLLQSVFYRNVDDDCEIEYAADQFKNENEFIHSVRRLSDQAVFTKNEVVGTPIDGQHHIGGFEVRGNSLYAQFSVGQISIEHLQKLPQPPLTTSDGFEILEDREIIVVYLKDHSCSIGPLSGFHPDVLDNNKVFVYDYNAHQYILENKPLLSLNDVKEWVEAAKRSNLSMDFILEKTERTARQKLNQ